ncbi:MAG: DEAD/DEAH box helicase [Rubrobacteridae bacterium]|nr:DEAD/DEAH box helicase [Rubrobacteridae bacterium]
MSFKRLGLEIPLVEWAETMKFVSPTPIQTKVIPQALAGRDIVGCAQTGSGKTAAFILPTMQRISDRKNVKALIVTPTRELANQIEEVARSCSIEEVARSCSSTTSHKVLAVYGGVPYAPQGRKLKQGIDVLVATPGRLLDMVRRGDANLSNIEVFVLDEADRMLDMGFLPDVKRIIKELPKKRQNMLFSATMSQAIYDIIYETFDNPVRIEVNKPSTPAKAIQQAVYPVAAMQKTDLLVAMLRQRDFSKTLVFVRTKRRAAFLNKVLSKRGIPNVLMHSDRTQRQRQEALNKFKRGSASVLIATDIIARGIDVENITHVVNYDIPGNPEDYIHRIGRTARANARGTAISLFSGEERVNLRDIESHIGQAIKRERLSGFEYEKQTPTASSKAVATPVKVVYDGGARRGMRRKAKRR